VEGTKNAEGDTLERIIIASCEAETLKITKYDHSNEAMFRSDGASFLEQGVPATMFFTYWHADYHAVGDHAVKIAYPRLAKISRAALRITLGVADCEPGLRINPDTPLKGRPLGIRGEDIALGDGSGGVKISYVAPEGALGKAGLLTNDTIVGCGSGPLSGARPLADLWRRVQFASSAEQGIEILRGGEKRTLKASWNR
jgi:hypothetical protein